MVTNISYRRSEEAWLGIERFIQSLIVETKSTEVCNIGGGANPLLTGEFVEQTSINYAVIDISESELKKSKVHCHNILGDIASQNFSIDRKNDLVFSKMLAEHIPNAEQFHLIVFGILNSGGIAVHIFPTLYVLPFLVNVLIPEYLSEMLLTFLAPRNMHQYAKFPAYCRWCRGPTRAQINKYQQLGYDVVEYRGFFGHKKYYNKAKIIRTLHAIKTNYLLSKPNPYFTSYSYVVLRRRTT